MEEHFSKTTKHFEIAVHIEIAGGRLAFEYKIQPHKFIEIYSASRLHLKPSKGWLFHLFVQDVTILPHADAPKNADWITFNSYIILTFIFRDKA